jgi:Putative Flp pilus-assembly TadE/G-like
MKRNDRLKNRPMQRGQAILWFLATTAACCATLALVYNVGQVTNEKEKTINAADAAALSGGLVEARMLNFMAYTNRAMIANEVTIAQLVSLDAWVQYDNRLAQNLATVTSFIPYVDEVTQVIADITDVAQQGVDDAARITIPATDYFVQGLGLAREAANVVAVTAAKDVASQVAQANQTTFGGRFDVAPQEVSDNAFQWAAFAVNQANWLGFSKVYAKNSNGNDDRANAAQVVQDSRDQFSTHRGAGLLIDGINAALGGPLLAVNGIDKTSGDTVLRNYDRWEAQDSADWWVGVKVLGITVGKKDLIPLGWGRADTDKNGTNGNDWDFGGGPCTQYFALGCELAYENDNAISGFSGIPGIRDLSKPGNSNTSDPSLTYVVAVKKSADAAMTTQRLGSGMNNVHVDGPQGSPDLQDNLQKDQITSISAARVFFARPDWNSKDITEGNLPRADHVHEYASLYNPYWQARLTTPDIATTSLLYAAIGKPGLNLAMP